MPKRTYKRDSIGRFASGGSSSASKPMGKKAHKEAQSIARMKKAMETYSKHDPAADAKVRADAAARKLREKRRSDRAAADVKKYNMVGYRRSSRQFGSGYGG